MSDPARPRDLPELKLLRLFDVLYATRSVTRAAEQLGPEPADGEHLAGQAARATARSAVRAHAAGHAADAARRRADRPGARGARVAAPARRPGSRSSRRRRARRRFRICMTDASHITLLPQLLAHVRASAPQVRLEARAHRRPDTRSALEAGEADLALGFAPWLESGIYQQTLFPQDWVCLADPAHPRIGRTLEPAPSTRTRRTSAIAAGTGAATARRRAGARTASSAACCSSCPASSASGRSSRPPT